MLHERNLELSRQSKKLELKNKALKILKTAKKTALQEAVFWCQTTYPTKQMVYICFSLIKQHAFERSSTPLHFLKGRISQNNNLVKYI